MTNVKNFKNIAQAEESEALVVYMVTDYESDTTDYGIVTDSFEEAKKEAHQLAIRNNIDLSVIKFERTSYVFAFEDGDEIWSTKEEEPEYDSYDFESREELESWIDAQADKDDNRYYWGFIENLNGWYSLNDLLADISDDWFEDPNGNKMTVTIYEAC